jgi:O-antigen ligase
MAHCDIAHPPQRKITDISERVAEWSLLFSVACLPVSYLAPWSYLSRGALAVAAAAGLVVVFRRGEIEIPDSPITLALMLFVVVSTASVIWSVDPYLSAEAVSSVLLRVVVVFLLVACAPRDPARLKRLAMALALGGLFLASVCLVLLLGGVRNPWGGVTGPSIGYNPTCMLLLLTGSFVLCLALEEMRRNRPSWRWRVAWVVTLTTILLTFSRIGWLALVVLLAVWWGFSNRLQRRFLVASCCIAIAVFVVVVPDFGRVLSVTDNSRFLAEDGAELDASLMKSMRWMDLVTMNDRATYAWKPAWAIIRSHPILGAGYGPSTFLRLTPSETPLLLHEHNTLLSVTVQSGVVGLAAFVALLVVLVRSLLAGLKTNASSRNPLHRGLGIAVLAAILSEYVVHGLGEPINNGKLAVMLAILAAIATILVTRDRDPIVMRLTPRPHADRGDSG